MRRFLLAVATIAVVAGLAVGWWLVRNEVTGSTDTSVADPAAVATANAAMIAGVVSATAPTPDAGPGDADKVGVRPAGPASATTDLDQGESTPTSPAHPSKASDPRAQFLRGANSICVRSDARLEAGIERILAKNATSPAAIQEQRRQVYSLVVTDVRRHIDELEDLTPTAGLERKFGDYIREMRAGLRTIEGQGPDRFFEQRSDPFAKALGLARDMELEECA